MEATIKGPTGTLNVTNSTPLQLLAPLALSQPSALGCSGIAGWPPAQAMNSWPSLAETQRWPKLPDAVVLFLVTG